MYEKHLFIVTGGASGIGRAVVCKLLAQGCRVIFLDNDKKQCQETLQYARARLPHAFMDFVHCDVTRPPQIEAAASKIFASQWMDGCEGFHVVSNAGRAIPSEFESMYDATIETWDKSIRLNLSSHFYVAKCILYPTFERPIKARTLTFISSINAILSAGLPAYSAAKAGLMGLTKCLAVPLGKMNKVRVNSILSGSVRPSNSSKREPKDYTVLSAHSALGAIAEEDDVADAVMSIALIMGHMTGQSLVLDGGQSIYFPHYTENV